MTVKKEKAVSGKKAAKTAGPSILVIGGPEGEDYAKLGVDRIGCDYAAIMVGPQSRPYIDYDFILFWPDASRFRLPANKKIWAMQKELHPQLPDIPQNYWTFQADKQGNPSETKAQDALENTKANEAADELERDYRAAGRSELFCARQRVFEIIKSTADACLVEKVLFVDCCLRLRPIFKALPRGLVLISLLPLNVSAEVLRAVNMWISKYLIIHGKSESKFFRASAGHSVLDMVLVEVGNTSPKRRWILHNANIDEDGDVHDIYGDERWCDILPQPEDFDPPGHSSEDPSFWDGHDVDVVVNKAEIDSSNDAGALLFQSKLGGVIITTAPETLSVLIDALKGYDAARHATDSTGVKKAGRRHRYERIRQEHIRIIRNMFLSEYEKLGKRNKTEAARRTRKAMQGEDRLAAYRTTLRHIVRIGMNRPIE